MTRDDQHYFPTSMVLVRGADAWRGLALELNVAVAASCPEAALLQLVEAIGTTLCAELEGRRPSGVRHPPDTLWDLFHEVMREGAPADDLDAYDQVVVPALFVVEKLASGLVWSQSHGTPLGASVRHPYVQQVTARIHTLV
jgi:hypothetical protein